MAIKVIETKPDARVIKRKVCPNCGAMLEYTPSDERQDNRTDYTGSTDVYTAIDCPQCKYVIILH